MITHRKDLDGVQPWPTKREHLVRRRQDGEIVDLGTDTESTMGIAPVIADDEPVLLLDSSDRLASMVADFYADLLISNGAEKELVDSVVAHARRMRDYRDEHYDGGRLPDIDKGWLRG